MLEEKQLGYRQHSINSQCRHGEHAVSSCTSGSFLLLLFQPGAKLWGAVWGACPIPSSATGTAEPACVWQELWLLFALGEIKTNGALAIATVPARRT